MLTTYATLPDAITAAGQLSGKVEIYHIGGRFSFARTSGLCKLVAIRKGGEWQVMA